MSIYYGIIPHTSSHSWLLFSCYCNSVHTVCHVVLVNRHFMRSHTPRTQMKSSGHFVDLQKKTLQTCEEHGTATSLLTFEPWKCAERVLLVCLFSFLLVSLLFVSVVLRLQARWSWNSSAALAVSRR